MMDEKEFNLKMKKIKLFVTDMDGTLTDGGLYSSEHEHFKRMSFRDGMGIILLVRAGILTALVTADDRPIAERWQKKLGIHELFCNCQDKSRVIKALKEQYSLDFDEIAFMGDDVNDLHSLNLVGLSLCPSDAHPEIRKICSFISPFQGGFGAIRDFCDRLLTAQNKPINLPEPW
jgi:3-deoxy-D-manno-octulosonate 8-phosphate phosphatase (KDO 8-P phosphatase)